MRIFFLSSLFALISACGGSGGTTSITFKELEGTYKLLFDERPDDEYFTVIKRDGTMTDYDFQGDSHSMGDNCYMSFSATTRQLGNNRFEAKDEFITYKFTLNRIEDGYVAEIFEVDGEPKFIDIKFESSSLIDSDFQPEC